MTVRRSLLLATGVTALLGVLFLELLAVNLNTSMSWDEGHHLFDGYTILKHHDFGLNPEVPPSRKLSQHSHSSRFICTNRVSRAAPRNWKHSSMAGISSSRTTQTNCCFGVVLRSLALLRFWLCSCFSSARKCSIRKRGCSRCRSSFWTPIFSPMRHWLQRTPRSPVLSLRRYMHGAGTPFNRPSGGSC